ncbi:hypothetical protein FRC00_013600, partial [Tulasnella sp. 408]
TVIFFLFVTTSLASSIGSYLSDKPYNYDFTLLSVAVGLVYAYGMGLPAALWALMRYLSVTEWGLVEWLAVWGYGMTAEQKSTRLLVPIIAVIHLGIALTLKILFFSYYIVKEVGVKEPDALPSSPVGPDNPAPTAFFL